MKLSILEYLQKMITGSLTNDMTTHMCYPSPISQTLGIMLKEIGLGTATLGIETKMELHANQQGTIHGGLISELADATIGTAHSTYIEEGQSLTSIDLKVNFYRPVFDDKLTSKARPLQKGKNVSHYICEITNQEGKIIAIATSTVMTLYGNRAMGR